MNFIGPTQNKENLREFENAVSISSRVIEWDLVYLHSISIIIYNIGRQCFQVLELMAWKIWFRSLCGKIWFHVGISGEWSAVRDSASDAEPVPGHAAGRPCPEDPVLWSAQERVLLRPEPPQLRRHLVLLPEWREAEAACQRPARRLLGGDQVLRAGGIRHQQVQVGKVTLELLGYSRI